MKHLLSPKALELAAEFLRISEEIAAEGGVESRLGARVESKTIEEPTMNEKIENLMSNIDMTDMESIKRALVQAIMDEREECARICDLNAFEYTSEGAEVCANDIRFRSTYRAKNLMKSYNVELASNGFVFTTQVQAKNEQDAVEFAREYWLQNARLVKIDEEENNA